MLEDHHGSIWCYDFSLSHQSSPTSSCVYASALTPVLGFLVTEQPLKFHPLFDVGAKDIGPAIRHLDEVRAVAPFFFEILALAIGGLELRRALLGWEVGTDKNLKENYYPGDIGFDPFGKRYIYCAPPLFDHHTAFIGVHFAHCCCLLLLLFLIFFFY